MRWTSGCALVLALEFGEGRKRRGKSEEDGGWDSEEEQQDVALGLLLACIKGGRRGQKGYFVCTRQVCCGPHDHGKLQILVVPRWQFGEVFRNSAF